MNHDSHTWYVIGISHYSENWQWLRDDVCTILKHRADHVDRVWVLSLSEVLVMYVVHLDDLELFEYRCSGIITESMLKDFPPFQKIPDNYRRLYDLK